MHTVQSHGVAGQHVHSVPSCCSCTLRAYLRMPCGMHAGTRQAWNGRGDSRAARASRDGPSSSFSAGRERSRDADGRQGRRRAYDEQDRMTGREGGERRYSERRYGHEDGRREERYSSGNRREEQYRGEGRREERYSGEGRREERYSGEGRREERYNGGDMREERYGSGLGGSSRQYEHSGSGQRQQGGSRREGSNDRWPNENRRQGSSIRREGAAAGIGGRATSNSAAAQSSDDELPPHRRAAAARKAARDAAAAAAAAATAPAGEPQPSAPRSGSLPSPATSSRTHTAGAASGQAGADQYPTFVPRNPGVTDGTWDNADQAILRSALRDAQDAVSAQRIDASGELLRY